MSIDVTYRAMSSLTTEDALKQFNKNFQVAKEWMDELDARIKQIEDTFNFLSNKLETITAIVESLARYKYFGPDSRSIQ